MHPRHWSRFGGWNQSIKYLLKLLQIILMFRPGGEPMMENLNLVRMGRPTYFLVEA